MPLGIDVDCLPIADVPARGANPVIGDRAYGGTPEQVAAIGGAVAAGLMAGGVLPVLKHLPGHGRANADSHERLPVVKAAARGAGTTRFCGFPAAAPAAAGHDRPCRFFRHRPARAGHDFGHNGARSDSRLRSGSRGS